MSEEKKADRADGALVPEVLPPAKKGGNQPKHHAPKGRVISKLRRQKIVQAIIDGKTLKDAGIEVGLSPKTASDQVGKILGEPRTKEMFSRIMEAEGITDEFLAQKIRNLLDAKTTKFFQHEGVVIEEREVDALETQRKTAELATKLKGHLKDKSEGDVNIGLMALVVAAVRAESSGEDD